MAKTTRRAAAHAGSWYTDVANQLNSELSTWLGEVPAEIEAGVQVPIRGARAIIAPHAGYAYSGRAAAWAYKCVDPNFVKRVFILGPSHHEYLPGCAVSPFTEYETPLGNLKLDLDVIKELKNTGHFSVMSADVDEEEHSIEMHLPYIYKIFEDKIDSIRIVPILVGSLLTTSEVLYGGLLTRYLTDPSNLFVVSSDFCHWGHRFSYTHYSPEPGVFTSLHRSKPNVAITTPIYKSIETLDREGMATIEQSNHTEFVAYLDRTKNTICGRHPIAVLLCAIESLRGDDDDEEEGEEYSSDKGNKANRVDEPFIRFVYYEQSSQVTNERDSSVSYASAYVYLP